jgi:hypothetical protein
LAARAGRACPRFDGSGKTLGMAPGVDPFILVHHADRYALGFIGLAKPLHFLTINRCPQFSNIRARSFSNRERIFLAPLMFGTGKLNLLTDDK